MECGSHGFLFLGYFWRVYEQRPGRNRKYKLLCWGQKYKVMSKLFKDFFFLILTWGCSLILKRERERVCVWGGKGERHINWLLLIHAPTGYWTCNLDMCPVWELDPQPFSVCDDAPTNGATPARVRPYNSYLQNRISSMLQMKVPVSHLTPGILPNPIRVPNL